MHIRGRWPADGASQFLPFLPESDKGFPVHTSLSDDSTSRDKPKAGHQLAQDMTVGRLVFNATVGPINPVWGAGSVVLTI
jgi:hypothetical protein